MFDWDRIDEFVFMLALDLRGGISSEREEEDEVDTFVVAADAVVETESLDAPIEVFHLATIDLAKDAIFGFVVLFLIF